jgi:glutamine synthetase
MLRADPAELEEFLSARPDITGIDMLVPDMCCVLRGKRIARDSAAKLVRDGVRLPGSIYLLDTTGQNCLTIPYGTTDGDPDFACFAAAGTLKPVPWAGPTLGQCLASMVEDDGTPHFADPRQIVERAAAPLREMGLTPVLALELEFYLVEPPRGRHGELAPARAPGTISRPQMTSVYGIDDLHDFDAFLSDLEAACIAQGIPADTATSEYAPGQSPLAIRRSC